MAITEAAPTLTGWRGALDSYFGITERGSSVGREIRAGLTTFLAMAYIIVVNPAILSNAIDFDGAFPQLVTVTCMAAAFGTLIMALWAKLPFALAPGMGLNAYFTFVVVGAMGFEWEVALGAVFLSGILFLIISVTGLREWILGAIPLGLKHAITAGIGAFLAFIGFRTAGIISGNPDTLVLRTDWTEPTIWLAMGGLVVGASLIALRVRGALLIAIVATTVVAIITQLNVYFVDGALAPYPGIDNVFGFVWPGDLIGALDIGAALSTGLLTVVFTFLFVDFFDTAGTLIGLSDKAGMISPDGKLTAPRAAFAADGAATTFGAFLGTSSTTTYIESAAGVEDGARTGLASLTVAVLFLAAMWLAQVTTVIPAIATAPVLIIIGAMMMSGVAKVDWADYRIGVPAFLTVVGMPFTHSITDGITLGLVSYTLINAVTGKHREVHPVMYFLTIALIVRFFVVD